MSQRLNRFLCLMLVVVGAGCGDGSDSGRVDDVVEVTPSPFFSPEPTNPICRDVMGPDGAGGFLWKPASESDGNLVLVFPDEFERPFEQVSVFRKGDHRRNHCRYTGKANGNRQHWRCPLPGVFYDGRVEAVDIEQVCEWKVRRPKERND